MRILSSRRSDRVLCSLLVLLGLAVMPGVAAASTVVYSGTTSADQYPLVLTVSGSRIVGITSMWRASCTSGMGYSYGRAVSLAKAPIVIHKGRFSGSAIVPEHLVGGQSASVTLTLKGALKGAKLTGSMTGAMAVGSGPGGPADTCAVTDLRFTTRHQPRGVYGGATSQGLPVVVELASSPGSIKHLHIGWQATCRSGYEFQLGDFLSGGALIGGRFSGAFTTNESRSGGGTMISAYDLSGKLSGTAGRGTLKVTITPKDAAGTAEDSCTTPSVTFKVRS